MSNYNDLTGRLKVWTSDGYLDADLRQLLTDSLHTIEQLQDQVYDLKLAIRRLDTNDPRGWDNS